jgi:hypothetical protein
MAEAPKEKGDEVEEKIVLFDLAGLPSPDLIKDKPCYILGVDTEAPAIQVGNLIFRGKYEDIIGTGLLFTKSPDGHLQYAHKCFTKVEATSTSIKPKTTDNTEVTES